MDEYRYQLWQDGIMVAEVIADDQEVAIREIKHYAAQHEQDGPVEIRHRIKRPRPSSVIAHRR